MDLLYGLLDLVVALISGRIPREEQRPVSGVARIVLTLIVLVSAALLFLLVWFVVSETLSASGF
jgi:hypothetical protein